MSNFPVYHTFDYSHTRVSLVSGYLHHTNAILSSIAKTTVLKCMITTLVICLFSLINLTSLKAQSTVSADEAQSVIMGVYSFKGSSNNPFELDSNRLDVYVAVPYKVLKFLRANERYGAQYSLTIILRDSTGFKLSEKKINRNLVEVDGETTLGSTGKCDVTQTLFTVASGSISVDVSMTDALTKRTITVTRKASIPRYSASNTSSSSIMLVSSLEQNGDKNIITPFLGDYVSAMSEGFFAFFEIYSARKYDSLNAVVELYDGTTQIYKSKRQSIAMTGERTQGFVRVVIPDNIAAGNYTLRLVGLEPSAPKFYKESDYLFRSERTIIIERGVSGIPLTDIEKAIRQLRYIAGQTEMDSILAGTTPEDKRTRFEQYWKLLDPTPGTIRNEAFDDYYARVAYANKNYRSYNDGWLTDMGMVYIVLGPPTQIDRQQTRDGRMVFIWLYSSTNRRITFFDTSGFGDFRLLPQSGFSLAEKYQYGR
jgi:GWxTD domain-containing protein